MTDAEVICTWMEPRSADAQFRSDIECDQTGWWRHKWSVPNQCYRAWPNGDKTDSLDALWEVEAKLIGLGYRDHLDNAISLEVWRDAVDDASTWHATAEQKIKALAAVLRGALKVAE